MQRLLLAFLIFAQFALLVAADDLWLKGELTKSRLTADGELNQAKDQLRPIFQFKIEAGQLKFDRQAWQEAADKIDKDDSVVPVVQNNRQPLPQNAQVAVRQIQALQQRAAVLKAQRQSMLATLAPIPPLYHLFYSIQVHAQLGMNPSGIDLPNSSKRGNVTEWQAAFSAENLSGTLRLTSDGDVMELKELKPPNRKLTLRIGNDVAFNFQLEHPAGDSLSLRQNNNGECFLVTITGSKTATEHAATFVELAKQHRHAIDAELLPALAEFGFRPIVPTTDPAVRTEVLATLLDANSLRKIGEQLIAELDNDLFDTRENASNQLSDQFALFRDLIVTKLNDSAASPEVHVRLQRIVSERTQSKLPEETAAALNLADDPVYVVSLLTDATGDQAQQITKHLEKLTGENFGADVAAWQQWAAERQ